jgi:hypothetical protein
VRARRRAVAAGAELKLVVTAQIVRRVLGICGLDRLVSIYPSLEAALAARPPAPVLDGRDRGRGNRRHTPPSPAGQAPGADPCGGGRG